VSLFDNFSYPSKKGNNQQRVIDMTSEENVRRFAHLFRGNSRSYGAFHPKSGRMETLHREVGFDTYTDHVKGKVGLGVVPITDDSTCWFGAIDIDAHGDLPDIDLAELEARVRERDLPLTVCRSKSGGAHLYAFGSEPLPAKLLRAALAKWAEEIGHRGVEVFPKQDKLPVDSEGNRQLGNWLNLAWFDADNPDCLRYTVEGGKRRSFEYFLDLAESRKVSAAQLVERSSDEHAEAPPCIQKMISEGVGSGHRNEALYNMVIYLKQAYPETWRDKAFDLNARVFDKPLAFAEAKRTVASAGRRDYRYKCKEEPCRSRCRSAICVTRKFGITPDEKGELEMGKPPEFGPLKKYNTEPPRWILYVDKTPVTLTTSELMDFRYVRVAVADGASRLIAPMKNDRWQGMLHTLMEDVIEMEAPPEASVTGFVRSKLAGFFQRTDLSSDGSDPRDREGLLLGAPVVQLNQTTGQRCVYFRGADFIDYLKKNRSEELKGPNLWMALRNTGVGHCRMRVGLNVIPVWYTPLADNDTIELSPPEMETEF